MSTKSLAKADDQLLVARRHLQEWAGVYDEFGRELTHAHVIAHHQDLLGKPVIMLARHAAKHVDDPTHQYHADLAEAVHGRLKGAWHNDRFNEPIEFYAAKLMGVKESAITDFSALPTNIKIAADAALKKNCRPDVADWLETDQEFLNLFLTAGVTLLWQIAEGNASASNSGGSSAGVYALLNNAQGRIGVGDSSTAASAGQTDLQAGTNHTFVAMDSTYPTQSTNQTIFRATFGTSTANYSWQEFVIDNANGSNSTGTTRSGGTTLDRVVSNQGTKASGQTWQPSLTLSIS